MNCNLVSSQFQRTLSCLASHTRTAGKGLCLSFTGVRSFGCISQQIVLSNRNSAEEDVVCANRVHCGYKTSSYLENIIDLSRSTKCPDGTSRTRWYSANTWKSLVGSLVFTLISALKRRFPTISRLVLLLLSSCFVCCPVL